MEIGISYVDGYTYVSFNLTVRIAKALFGLAVFSVLPREYEIFFFDYYKYISS